MEKIQNDIDSNYASIRNLLEIINQGVTQIMTIQSYIRAEITSVSGILFFLTQFLIVLFLTSFPKFASTRSILLTILAAQITIEFGISLFMPFSVDHKWLRYIFIGVMMAYLFSHGQEDKLERVIADRFSTPRIERIIRKSTYEQNMNWAKNIAVSSLAITQKDDSSREKEGGREERRSCGKGRV